MGRRAQEAVQARSLKILGVRYPTFTDAALALGYINPSQLVDGGLRLNAAKSRHALQVKMRSPWARTC